MKNIHVLPTDKPSNLLLCIKDYIEHINTPAENSDKKGNFRLGFGKYTNTEFYQFKNIYITNDEEIKEGDWVYFISTNEIIKVPNGGFKGKVCKKIILTTDQDLTKDGVQAIDDDFLEWFVKNPSCESVETIYGLFNPMGRQVDPNNLGQNHSQCIWKHKIIIPKEEPKQECCQDTSGFYLGTTCLKCNKPFRSVIQEPKQETLEEAAQRIFDGFGDITKPSAIKRALELAKWQQKQNKKKFSDEEVLEILNKREDYINSEDNIFEYQSITQWFEQFKN